MVHHGREQWDQAMSEPKQFSVLKRAVFLNEEKSVRERMIGGKEVK